MPFTYPPARRADVVDVLHGVEVADPYRWTEDPDDPETIAFVEAQNALTLPYLEGLPERSLLHGAMQRTFDVARTGGPLLRNGVAVYARNDGLQNQPVYYVRKDGGPERVLLDPNALSEDGAVAVVTSSLSPDGGHFAYTVAEAGSDWQVIHIRDVATGEDLPEQLVEVKFSGIAWHGDGFFYSRFPGADRSGVGLTKGMSIYRHTLGTAQDTDTLEFANEEEPELGYYAIVLEGDLLALGEWSGTSTRNGLLVRDADGNTWSRVRPVGEAEYSPLHHHAGGLLVLTDQEAPNGRIARIDLADTSVAHTVIPEQGHPIETAFAADGSLFVVRVIDAAHVVERWSLDGAPLGTLDLPGPGAFFEASGRPTDREVLFAWHTFVQPSTLYRWDGTGVEHFAGEAPRSGIVVTRETAVSADGTEVGMFVLRAEGTELPAPTIVYGYGGFNINVTPLFDPARLGFLEAGGVIAMTNLRGGNEHGERWHEDGMLGNKQHVFDDFIACARHLKAVGIASKVGSHGRSNGGLLTGATVLQAPDAFDAVVAQVGVLDMYRYQHFTAGRYWTVEYGDAADAEAFEWLSAYSPLHNIGDPSTYPPILVTTAETDDRVVPMHSHKFAAELQHAAGGSSERPLLERIDRRAGHGLGKPVSKLIDESADFYGFLLHHLS
ncbi:MAG: S9 family peptidase [Acidimicrobiia bacterium]|nr:S9 family peptidase [Acidimicrobiia bacterium]